MSNTKRFQEGKVYTGRFICNYDRVVRTLIVKRTPKTVVFQNLNTGDEKRRKIRVHQDREAFIPCAGVYITTDKVEDREEEKWKSNIQLTTRQLEEDTMKKARLYWWYDGTPGDRPGGPWWYGDFSSLEKLYENLKILRPVLKAYAITDGLEQADVMNVQPPREQIVWLYLGQ